MRTLREVEEEILKSVAEVNRMERAEKKRKLENVLIFIWLIFSFASIYLVLQGVK